MSNDGCCCAGRCHPSVTYHVSRREFLHTVAMGTVGFGMLSSLTSPAMGMSRLAQSRVPESWSYPMTPARVYRSPKLEAVSMPIGGIGTGTVWLDGQGRLGTWQIFNNSSENRVPDSFFAIKANVAGKPSICRVLQTAAEEPLQPVQSLAYEGGYPIARLDFEDTELPVSVRMEAFNPLIPTDAASSSIPCAVFRMTVKNSSNATAEVSLIGTCQNAIGSRGSAGIDGVKFDGYGHNSNRVVRGRKMVSIAMEKSLEPVESCPVKVRKQKDGILPGPEMQWYSRLDNFSKPVVETLTRVSKDGGVVVAGDVHPSFFDEISMMRRSSGELTERCTVFEDFEQGSYTRWSVSGTAFGTVPSRGTHPGQQKVGGFSGTHLINTYLPDDKPQGTLTSNAFKIEKKYIGFLIGGGKHANETCVNLKIAGKVVRTATGRNSEMLEPENWDVGEFRGKDAVIEIVDKNSDGWGHVNVDQIVFSDIPTELLLKNDSPLRELAKTIGLSFASAGKGRMDKGGKPVMSEDAPGSLKKSVADWIVTDYTKLSGFKNNEQGYRAIVSAPNGDPLIIEGPLGKGRIVLALAAGLKWSSVSELFAALRTARLKRGETIVPSMTGWGTMALTVLNGDAVAAPRWTRREEIVSGLKPCDESGESPQGETFNCALSVPLVLKPGQEKTVTFVLSWHFPNVTRFNHEGNFYARRWANALEVARHVADNAEALWQRTRLYQETLYQSNIPEEFLDAMSSQSVIFRGPTCFWTERGYFAGYEGCYGCCPLNCTHVWNYAQSHAQLFPEIGRNMRISDLVTYLHEDGETSHRQHTPHGAFIDGHCATIEAAYREHLLSSDDVFLRQVWPGIKKAVDWMVQKFDTDKDGIPSGAQWNTYDTAMSGANTFIGSQYLSALAAAEKMAEVMQDPESGNRWRAIREAGMKNQNEKLWGGEYYIQIPDREKPDRDYNNGCLTDHLLGQWWAHMLNLGYLYPKDRVGKAVESIMKYNFRENFFGFKQVPRRYIPDEDGGLLIGSWPRDDRPKSFVLYADEVWTGIEYAAAGLMIYEGQVDSARRIVKMARSRYDGRIRKDLNSGPGGNPFNELECGKFYARAMSSWSLLLACQGIVQDGPRGIFGFKPRWQPADHRSFFTAPEGWGLFIQKRAGNTQNERIEVRHGRLNLKEMIFQIPESVGKIEVDVNAGKRVRNVDVKREGNEIRLVLPSILRLDEANTLEIIIRWS